MNFYNSIQSEKLKEAGRHWQTIGCEAITSKTLQESFKRAFLAYTDYGHTPVSSLASIYNQRLLPKVLIE